MKIFNVSPHRSGTQSFTAFCQSHGIAAAHWPGEAFDAAVAPLVDAANPDRLNPDSLRVLAEDYLDTADAFADLPVPLLHRSLFATYDDARYVLILRKTPSWVASVRGHMNGRGFSYLEKFFYWSLGLGEHEGLDGYSDLDLARGYEGFVSDVAWYLSKRRAPLLIADLDSPDLGTGLANFLGFKQTEAFAQIR